MKHTTFMVANVGAENNKEFRASRGFGDESLVAVRYYYNKKQNFISPNLKNIEILEGGGII